jgi:hypothetical protein
LLLFSKKQAFLLLAFPATAYLGSYVFWFFFSKRNGFLPLALRSALPPASG